LRAIDDNAIVAQGSAGKIVATPTNGKSQSMRTSPADGVNNVLDTRTTNQGCWTFVDLLIPKLTRLVIGRVLRKDEMARQE